MFINPKAVFTTTSDATTRILEATNFLTPKGMSGLQNAIEKTPLWNCNNARSDAQVAKRVFSNGQMQPVVEPDKPDLMLYPDQNASNIITDISQYIIQSIHKHFPEIGNHANLELFPAVQRKFLWPNTPQELIGHHRDGNSLATAIIDLNAPTQSTGGKFAVVPFDLQNSIPVDQARDVVTPQTNGFRMFINQTENIVNGHEAEPIKIIRGKKSPQSVGKDKIQRTLLIFNVKDPDLKD